MMLSYCAIAVLNLLGFCPTSDPGVNPTDSMLAACTLKINITYSRDVFSDDPWTETVYVGRNDKYVFIYSFREESEGEGRFVMWSVVDEMTFAGNVSNDQVRLFEQTELSDEWRASQSSSLWSPYLAIVERTDLSIEQQRVQANEISGAQNELSAAIQQARLEALSFEVDEVVVYDHFEPPPEGNLGIGIDELYEIANSMIPSPKAIDSL